MKLVVFILFFASSVFANDRQVIGGTILHTASAESEDESAANFLAQQAAIKLVITECAIAHKEIKIYKSETQRMSNGNYFATAQAGLPFSDCDEGKSPLTNRYKNLVSPEILKNQALYEKHLAKKLGIEEKNREPAITSEQLEELNQKLDSIDQKLDSQSPSREVVIIREPTLPSQKVAANPSKSACLAQYQSLISQADRAAAKNFPPGNYAQGEASLIWNQAQSVLRGCQ